MRAKEYLSQVYKQRKRIDYKVEQMNDLRTLLMNAEGLDYSKEKIQCGGCADAKIIRLLSLEEELNQLICRYITYKATVIRQIQRLDNFKYMRVLYERYIANRELADIATRLGYSYQYIRLLHGQALRNFETVNNFQQNNTH